MLLPQKWKGWSPAPPSEIYDLKHQENFSNELTAKVWCLALNMTEHTFLLEADLDCDKVLKEDIVDVRVVKVKELFQLWRFGIFWKNKKGNQRWWSALITHN